MAGTWPIAEIDEIIKGIVKSNKKSKEENKEYKEHLEKIKKEGRKYACIIFPNEYNINSVGNRIQMWDDEKKCIWNFDVLFGTEEDIPEKNSDGKRLVTFSQAIDEGIRCPKCGEELRQERWFSNE